MIGTLEQKTNYFVIEQMVDCGDLGLFLQGSKVQIIEGNWEVGQEFKFIQNFDGGGLWQGVKNPHVEARTDLLPTYSEKIEQKKIKRRKKV